MINLSELQVPVDCILAVVGRKGIAKIKRVSGDLRDILLGIIDSDFS